jgi:hypothetical protein
MERTTENIQHCTKQTQRFLSIRRDRPMDRADLDLCMDALMETLLKACSKPEVATIIVDAILDNEERWPSVATIRRWMRELTYVEMDVREREDRRIREEWKRRDAEAANRGKPCSLEVAHRIDKIVFGLDPTLWEGFRDGLVSAGDDEEKTECVLKQYELLSIPKTSSTE